MRAHKRVELTREQGKKYVKYDEGAALYSMGLNAFQRLAKEAQATVRVGRSVLLPNICRVLIKDNRR